MGKLVEVEGDLLTFDAEMIAHQTNCVSRGASGLAGALFKQDPSINIYAKRKFESEPGTVDIMNRGGNDDDDSREIAHLHAQFFPGPAEMHGARAYDTVDNRLRWMRNCLTDLFYIVRGTCRSIAFPYKLGCGLAGGHWPKYLSLIRRFALALPDDVTVYIVRRPGD